MSINDALLLRAVRDHIDFAGGGRVVAAVSGGADSMAMLDALATVAAETGLSIVVAHFDHRLRPDSADDCVLVAAAARARALAFASGDGDVRAHARHRKAGIEAAARELRYAFLEETATENDARWIATAHTRDDQIETVLMRILRGSGVRGLAGISRRRGRITRPLLDIPGAETRSYCATRGIPFHDDPTNEDLRFTRNRLRHLVLPLLRDHDRDIDARLDALAHECAAIMEATRARTDPVLARSFRADGAAWIVAAEAIAALGPFDRFVVLADAIDRIDPGAGVRREHFERVAALCDPHAPLGSCVSIPGWTVRREHDAIVFERGRRSRRRWAATAAAPTHIALPGTTYRDRIRVDVRIIAAGEVQEAELASSGRWFETGGGDEACVAYFDLNAVRPPLLLRLPREGDRMQPLGMNGRRKLSDIFVDRRVPSRKRASALVIEDTGGIICVPGIAHGESARIGAATRRVAEVLLRREPREQVLE